MTLVINRQEDFNNWASKLSWLQDVVVDHIDPLPNSLNSAPATAKVVLRLQTGGGITAGDRRRMQRIVLTCAGLVRYQLSPGGFSPGNCCQGLDVDDSTTSSISFTLDVPGELQVACRTLAVQVSEYEEHVPLWMSDLEFFVEVPVGDVPTPRYWSDVLEDRGVPVCWRYHGGEAIDERRVPSDYVGWCLQHPRLVSSTTDGLIFLGAAKRRAGFYLAIQDRCEDGGVLFRACGRIAASFPHAIVRCGNAQLSADLWLRHLDGERITLEQLVKP